MSKTRRRGKGSVSLKKWAESQGKFVSNYLKKPDGVELFKVQKEGIRRINVIPYTVGNGVRNRQAEPGVYHSEHEFFVHKNVGPSKKDFLCPQRMADKPCPICEFQAELAADPEGDEKVVNSLYPRQRQLWNVVDLDETEKGVQLWDVSMHLFGKLLSFELKNKEEDENYDELADPDKGYVLKIKFEEKKFTGMTYYEAKSISFLPRKESTTPTDEQLEQAIVLDECLQLDNYETIHEAFHAQDQAASSSSNDDDDDSKKKSSGSKPHKSVDDDEEFDDNKSEEDEDDESNEENNGKRPIASDYNIKEGMKVIYEDDVYKVINISKDGTSLLLEDSDGETTHAGPDEVKVVKKKKSVEKPTVKPTKPVKKPKPKSEEEETPFGDDDDDEEWDE